MPVLSEKFLFLVQWYSNYTSDDLGGVKTTQMCYSFESTRDSSEDIIYRQSKIVDSLFFIPFQQQFRLIVLQAGNYVSSLEALKDTFKVHISFSVSLGTFWKRSFSWQVSCLETAGWFGKCIFWL